VVEGGGKGSRGQGFTSCSHNVRHLHRCLETFGDIVGVVGFLCGF
jgi:hypothetical protein